MGLSLLLALISGCAHTRALSDGAAEIPVPALCGDRGGQGAGQLLSQVAAQAELSGGDAFLLAGEALMLAAERDLPGAEVEFFQDEERERCVELLQFWQVVDSVADPALQMSLQDARALKPRAQLGGEVRAPVVVALSPEGERLLAAQRMELPREREALIAQLAAGWSLESGRAPRR